MLRKILGLKPACGGRNFVRNSSAAIMPPCNHKPKPYAGPNFEKVKKIKQENLVPCLLTYYRKPLLIHEGKMQWLFDHEGRRYLDMFGGIVTVSVGHCHPRVTDAAVQQMNQLWHTTNIYMHPKIHEYAETLAEKFPGELKVFYFVNSGSEANDLALFMARAHTKNSEVVSLRNGYHGMSPYIMGATALSTWKYNVNTGGGVHHTMNPDVYRGTWGGSRCRDSPVQTTRECTCTPETCEAAEHYYEQLQDVFRYSLPSGHVGAFIAESIQGVGGTVQFPKGYLKKAYEIVKANGGVCIADEVQTGFGRTGEHFWGFEMHGVTPDIVTMAKGMGNGFPMAGVVTTPAIAQSLSTALHFNTFGGNPVASAVGKAVLEVIEEEQLQRNCEVVGTHLLKGLAQLRSEFEEVVGDVRGKGLMVGVELVADPLTRAPLSSTNFVDIWEDCKDMGVLLGRGGLNGNVLRIKPPMCITAADADFTVEVLRKALSNHLQKKRKHLS
ncbi:alanine--glyoxylate aminotransferase 2, mitochondrial [Hetaerina americana]|uniref:alanine--glyoxylate aminotransferase 2, mitochondrial n=1 Tax=Hetaerina americana TaxID=62018 RepID=UPI003A7F3E3F